MLNSVMRIWGRQSSCLGRWLLLPVPLMKFGRKPSRAQKLKPHFPLCHQGVTIYTSICGGIHPEEWLIFRRPPGERATWLLELHCTLLQGCSHLLSRLPCTSQWLPAPTVRVCLCLCMHTGIRPERKRPTAHSPSRKWTKSDTIYSVPLQTIHSFSLAAWDTSFCHGLLLRGKRCQTLPPRVLITRVVPAGSCRFET